MSTPRTTTRFPDPAREAELAHRREQVRAAAQRGPARRNSWLQRSGESR